MNQGAPEVTRLRRGDLVLGRWLVQRILPSERPPGRIIRSLRGEWPFDRASIHIDPLEEGAGESPITRLAGQGPVWRMVDILSRVSHPAVVRLLDSGRHRGRATAVLSWAKGDRLTARLVRRLGPQRGELAVQLAEAVAALHDAGIVHRRIEPSGIVVDMRSARPRLTLVDFYDALPVSGVPAEPAGALGWAAPEQVLEESCPLDLRSDLYSLGLVLCSLLSGEPPFVDPIRALSETVRDGSFRIPRSVATALPRGVLRLIEALVAAEPAGRTLSAHEVAEELRSLRAERSSRVSASPDRSGGPPPSGEAILAAEGSDAAAQASMWALRAEWHLRILETSEALRFAQRAIELDSAASAPWITLARCSLAAQDAEAARRAAARAARGLEHDDLAGAIRVMRVAVQAGDSGLAVQVCDRYRAAIPYLLRLLLEGLREVGPWPAGLAPAHIEPARAALWTSLGVACAVLLRQAEEHSPAFGEVPLDSATLRGWLRSAIDALGTVPSAAAEVACLCVLAAGCSGDPNTVLAEFVDAVAGPLDPEKFPIAGIAPLAEAFEDAALEPKAVAAYCQALVLTHLGCSQEAIRVLRASRCEPPVYPHLERWLDVAEARLLLVVGQPGAALDVLGDLDEDATPVERTVRGLVLVAVGQHETGLRLLEEEHRERSSHESARWLCAGLSRAGSPAACVEIVTETWARHGRDDSLVEWAIRGFVAAGELASAARLADHVSRVLAVSWPSRFLGDALEDMAANLDIRSSSGDTLRQLTALLLQLGRAGRWVPLYEHLFRERGDVDDLERLTIALQLASRVVEAAERSATAARAAVLAGAPDASRFLAVAVRQALQLDRAERALEGARGAVEARPADPDLWCLLAEAEFGASKEAAARERAGHQGRAADAAARALELAPDHPYAVLLMSEALVALGRGAEAAPYALRALEGHPNLPRAHVAYLACLGTDGEAEAALLAAERACPDSPLVLGTIARVHASSGREEEAARAAHRALELAPPEGNAWRALLELARRTGHPADLDAIARCCEQAGGPSAASAAARLHGLCLSGHYARAVEVGLEAVELEPRDPETWCSMSLAWAATGDAPNAGMAVLMMERYGATGGAVARAHLLVAITEQELPRARAWADAAVKLRPDDGDARFARGLLHLAEEHRVEAGHDLSHLCARTPPFSPDEDLAAALRAMRSPLSEGLRADRAALTPEAGEALWWAHGLALLVTREQAAATALIEQAVLAFPRSEALWRLRVVSEYSRKAEWPLNVPFEMNQAELAFFMASLGQ